MNRKTFEAIAKHDRPARRHGPEGSSMIAVRTVANARVRRSPMIAVLQDDSHIASQTRLEPRHGIDPKKRVRFIAQNETARKVSTGNESRRRDLYFEAEKRRRGGTNGTLVWPRGAGTKNE
jgi:hypothetical protein